MVINVAIYSKVVHFGAEALGEDTNKREETQLASITWERSLLKQSKIHLF